MAHPREPVARRHRESVRFTLACMRFAVFTVSTPNYTPEEAVQVFSELGYAGVEWRVTDQSPSPSGAPSFWAGNIAARCRCGCSSPTCVHASRPWPRAPGLETMECRRRIARCDDLAAVEQVLHGAQLLGAPSARVNVPRYDGTWCLGDAQGLRPAPIQRGGGAGSHIRRPGCRRDPSEDDRAQRERRGFLSRAVRSAMDRLRSGIRATWSRTRFEDYRSAWKRSARTLPTCKSTGGLASFGASRREPGLEFRMGADVRGPRRYCGCLRGPADGRL